MIVTDQKVDFDLTIPKTNNPAPDVLGIHIRDLTSDQIIYDETGSQHGAQYLKPTPYSDGYYRFSITFTTEGVRVISLVDGNCADKAIVYTSTHFVVSPTTTITGKVTF